MHRRKTPEEVAWLIREIPKGTSREVHARFEEAFGWAPKLNALQTWASKRHLHFAHWGDSAQTGSVRTVRWSKEPEMKEWMLENDRGQPTGEVSRAFEERFGFPLSKPQVSLFRSTYNRQSRRSHGGGRKPVPVGTEREAKGYIRVKVAPYPTVPQSKDNWRFKHHVVWEEANGRPVPEGHLILFVDGDRRNFDPDNLVAVPRRDIAKLNNMTPEGGWPDRETLEAAADIAALKNAISAAMARPRPCAICGELFEPDTYNGTPINERTCRACLDSGHKFPGERNAGTGICEKCGCMYTKNVRRQRFCSDCSTANR